MLGKSSLLRWQRLFYLFATIVLIAAVLYVARSVLIPAALAILVTFLLAPAVSHLERLRFGRVPSVLLVLSCTLLGLAALGFVVGSQVASLGADLPKYESSINEKLDNLRSNGEESWLKRTNAMLSGVGHKLQELVGEKNPSETLVVAQSGGNSMNWLQSIVPPAIEILVNTGMVFLLVTFMLLGREDLRNRMVALWKEASLPTMTKALDEAAERMSRFLRMQLLINATYGVALTIGLWAIGLPHAILCGFLAATLRYIPYLGPWIAAIIPLAISVSQSPGWMQPMLVLALVAVLELLSNNIMEPVLYAHSTGTSEVAILVSAAFWALLWGPIGLILSVPLTTCLVVLGKYIPQVRIFYVLLGNEPVLNAYVSLYQRLLAGDTVEAKRIFTAELAKQPTGQVYDELVLPALALTKQAVARNGLGLEGARSVSDEASRMLEVHPAEQSKEEKATRSSPEDAFIVLGCPVSDPTEETALRFLAELFEKSPKRMLHVLPEETLSGELIQAIRTRQPRVVCLGVLPPQGLKYASRLCKRLRHSFPDLRIAIGCWGWGGKGARMREGFRRAGADLVGLTLQETATQLSSLVNLTPSPRIDDEYDSSPVIATKKDVLRIAAND